MVSVVTTQPCCESHRQDVNKWAWLCSNKTLFTKIGGWTDLACATSALKEQTREFPGGPVVRTLPFHCRGTGLIPGRGTKIPQVRKRPNK